MCMVDRAMASFWRLMSTKLFEKVTAVTVVHLSGGFNTYHTLWNPPYLQPNSCILDPSIQWAPVRTHAPSYKVIARGWLSETIVWSQQEAYMKSGPARSSSGFHVICTFSFCVSERPLTEIQPSSPTGVPASLLTRDLL